MNAQTGRCNLDFVELVRLGALDTLRVARRKGNLNPTAQSDYDAVCAAIVARARCYGRVLQPLGSLPVCRFERVLRNLHESCSTLRIDHPDPRSMRICSAPAPSGTSRRSLAPT